MLPSINRNSSEGARNNPITTRPARTKLSIIGCLLIAQLITSSFSYPISQKNDPHPEPEGDFAGLASHKSFLPMLVSPTGSPPSPRTSTGIPTLNIPYFQADFSFGEAAVAWFGSVNLEENYADVRVGYTQDELKISLQIIDHDLWYNKKPDPADLSSWDAVSIFLIQEEKPGAALRQNTYRFDAQLNWWEDREKFQAAFRGDGSQWRQYTSPFSTTSLWKGSAPNDAERDRGWKIAYSIPFTSLGLQGPPAEGTRWRLAVRLSDRDAADRPVKMKSWPAGTNPDLPASWGYLRFGLPVYTPPAAAPSGSTLIRNKLAGARVTDAMVGGSSNCGGDFDFWTEWGDGNYPGSPFLNVQNQHDISDWPCFSKAYITFPLDGIPPGKALLSARLTLHLMGNAGGGEWGPASRSLIQVSTVGEDWKEETLTWNNAPLALENVSQSWVDPIAQWPGWPGVPWTWDLSRAVAEAYAAGQPLRLVLYSADTAYNTGKYFSSSNVDDWNELSRPALDVVWGDR